MNVSQVQVSALGPSAPILIAGYGLAGKAFGSPDSPRYSLQPSVIACLSAGASLGYVFEVTADLPDASGSLPVSGNWVRYDALLAGGEIQSASPLSRSCRLRLTEAFTAIRANVVGYASGSLTLGVVQ